jgi:hypothetical protein
MIDFLNKTEYRQLNRRLKRYNLKLVDEEIDFKSTDRPVVFLARVADIEYPNEDFEVVVYPKRIYIDGNPSHWDDPEYMEKVEIIEDEKMKV